MSKRKSNHMDQIDTTKTKKYQVNPLSIQERDEEIDNKMKYFDELIKECNNQRFNRSNINRNMMNLAMVFKEMTDYFQDKLTIPHKNKLIDNNFYWKYSGLLIQQILDAWLTPLGKLLMEYKPILKDVVISKLKRFSKSSPNPIMETVTEIKDLRRYSQMALKSC